jgi:hypothetical protein
MLGPALGPAVRAEYQAPELSSDTIIHRLVQMNEARKDALRRYRSQRRYFVDNSSYGLHAEVSIQETYSFPGKKEFKVFSASGSPFLRHKVIDRLMEAEIDDTSGKNRDQGQLSPANYVFRQIGTEALAGRPSYVFEVSPKTPRSYLMRGRVWVDAEDFAIVRMEGSTAKNPSFWTRRTHFVRKYEKHGQFWLPASVETDSDVLLAGKSTLRIDYSGYEINSAADTAVAITTTSKQGGN